VSTPAKYRKKPVVIDAVRLPAVGHRGLDDLEVIAKWSGGDIGWGATGAGVLVHTLEGTMRAEQGDWIICGVKGEFYPCKPDIFEATYEPAGDAE
jgi:hypothetical protein